MKKSIFLSIFLLCCAACSTERQKETYDVPLSSIRCSDPFIYADSGDSTYYMYSTGGGGRVMARASKDLTNWTEPFTVMSFSDKHWAGDKAASWASEVHHYNGKYYLFTTSHSDETIESIPGRCDIPHRATQIYVADSPRGPFKDFTGRAHTPDDWAALDGTLWVEDGIPYMIFCHEWLQTTDGPMELVQLPEDLGVPAGKPVTLFKASDAVWSGEMLELGEKTNGLDLGGHVTDGPWLFRTQTGRLGMLWSTWGRQGYSIGAAYSASGSVKGPWIQEDEPLYSDNGGHGMLFRTFDGDLKLCMHRVDERDEFPGRRPVFLDVDDSGNRLAILPEKEPVVFRFDKTKTMPGRKVALTEFDPDFPTDWSGYDYLVLEMSCTSGQRAYLGLNTEEGYNELRIIFYAPNGRIRTAIPLSYFRELPAGAHDLAATYNHRRPMSYINIDHGTRHDLKGVDSLGIRMHCPVRDEEIRLEKVYLTVGDPGDKYLGAQPAVDGFGQWNLGEFEGKVHSEAELKAEWAREDRELAKGRPASWSAYGGDLSRTTEATGFFDVREVDGKWWFVDPDGHLFLSISSNGISPGGGGTIVNPLKGVYYENAPEGFELPAEVAERYKGRKGDRPQTDSRGRAAGDRIIPLTAWNQYRRFGPGDVGREACGLVVSRMDSWGMNTIGNWSSREVIALGRKPFMISLGGLGIQDGILGMPDVYAEGFAEAVDEGVRRSVEPYRNDKMLIGYFIGNEPAWSNRELRLCDLILDADRKTPLRKALASYLRRNGDSPESRKAFVYETFDIFLGIVQEALDRHDPDHLNLGIRFGTGMPSAEVLALCRKYFDVYSFNNYGILPDLESMDEIHEATGLPMIIGEFHFGTTDRGLGESLVRVTSQEDRGTAYKNYCEAAFSHKALIGTSWFTWYDQPLFGRGDGENYNIGLIDATDRPYKWMVKAIRDVSRDCYAVHEGRQAPCYKELERTGGSFPDFWETD